MRGVFVTGTDTEIGKTVASAALLAGARSLGATDAVYWKPVQTGATLDSDIDTIRALAGRAGETPPAEGLSFQLPSSPHHAAAAEGRPITLAPLLRASRGADAPARRWVVEGAGGLLVPLSETLLMSDLARALGLPLVVVASTRLGTINHTLLTVRQAHAERLGVLGIVLVGPEDRSARTGITAHTEVPILGRLDWLDPLAPRAVAEAGRRLIVQAPALLEALV